uniref:Uncharacterized protein n=1 Tax=Physcomitrium patens TaxID=3218 RepID=A9T503_PHYPA|nr:hypothetical protein PHYPA_025056 [Physcomitrium patens]
MKAEVKAAHEGSLVHNLNSNNFLFSGGADLVSVHQESYLTQKIAVIFARASSCCLVYIILSSKHDYALQLVRIWDPESLASIRQPMQLHAAGARSLYALTSSSMPSPAETIVNSTIWLVSGDAHGYSKHEPTQFDCADQAYCLASENHLEHYIRSTENHHNNLGTKKRKNHRITYH